MQSYIHKCFEEQVRRTPGAIAVIFEQDHLTYQELNERANALAHYLRRLNVKPETLVGLCLERSFSMIVGLLGILKAGGAYVPIDPAYPKERIALILDDSKVSVLLTAQGCLSPLVSHSAKVVCLDKDWTSIVEESRCNPEPLTEPHNLAPHNLAYVIYTSGSTGRPKGVMIEHRSLTNFVEGASQAYGIGADDRVLQFSSICFDAAVEEIFATLTQGATLILRTVEMMSSISTFFKDCRAFDLTVLDLPTAFWHKICAELHNFTVPETLRLVIIGGERVQPRWLDLWKEHVSSTVRLINTYGPTESTVVATYCDLAGAAAIPAQNNRVPIGKPIPNIQVHVLNSDLQTVEAQTAGELYLSGLGLARGYLNRPDLTHDQFISRQNAEQQTIRLYKTGDIVRYREDGQLEYLDRIDHQAKIRGFRVDLGEIEIVLQQHPSVCEAIVVAKEDVHGQKRLVAYILQNLQQLDDADLLQRHRVEEEQITQWRIIHNDDQLNPAKNNWDQTFNISGWISSYTGELISDPEMQEWVDHTISRIQELKPKKVLEIGCGTGLLLFRLAPQCSAYLGTDFSETALNYVEHQLRDPALSLPQVSLQQRKAHDFDGIEPQSFDTVILNSVLQYFPSVDYLLGVLEKAVQVVQPGGSVFVGDVRNYLLLEAFAVSVELFRASDDLSTRELRQNISSRLYHEEELTIAPAFFSALARRIPQITEVNVLLKRGRFLNELNPFRYDVILKVDSIPKSGIDTPALDWQRHQVTVSKLNTILQDKQPQTFEVSGVPNARLFAALHALEVLQDPSCPENIGMLRQVLAHSNEQKGIDPMRFWELAQTLPYDITISWANSGGDGAYSVFFRHTSLPCARPERTTKPVKKLHPDLNQPWSAYANNPLKTKIHQDLIGRVRTDLSQKLPLYMLPSAFVVLDSFPLTPNGKVDRRALPAPTSDRPLLSIPYVAPRTSLEQELAKIWSKVLEIDVVGINDQFFELGGDSLRLIQLTSQIEAAYSFPISISDFFANPTITGLVEEIQRSHQLNKDFSSERMTLEQLKRESFLDIPIQLKGMESSHWLSPGAVFLTGATGFIGAFILYEILQQTKATVYCLIRAESKVQAYQRLRQTFQKYLPDVEFSYARIVPIIGDISRPLLGMPKAEFEQLAESIDVIYHSAANVNLLYPYAALKASNVIGTKSILKLATYTKAKPVHYISTLDVFESLAGTGVPMIYENDSIAQGNGIIGGYSQSKWIGERLIADAKAQGLPTCIYRPGMVTGHHKTGVSNPEDLMSRLLKTFIQLKSAPNLDLMIDMTPVDYISKAVVHLSLQPTSLDQAFHLVNPNPKGIDKLILEMNNIGYSIEKVKYEDWKTALNNESNSLSPLKNIVTETISGNLSRLEIWLSGSQIFDCSNTVKGLQGSEIYCPYIKSSVVKKYISHIFETNNLNSEVNFIKTKKAKAKNFLKV
jgi:amino acid adenylation domain-containing protein/thioester reductase-like protein